MRRLDRNTIRSSLFYYCKIRAVLFHFIFSFNIQYDINLCKKIIFRYGNIKDSQ